LSSKKFYKVRFSTCRRPTSWGKTWQPIWSQTHLRWKIFRRHPNCSR